MLGAGKLKAQSSKLKGGGMGWWEAGMLSLEVGGQRSEFRSQRSEVGGRSSEVRGRRSEVGEGRSALRSPGTKKVKMDTKKPVSNETGFSICALARKNKADAFFKRRPYITSFEFMTIKLFLEIQGKCEPKCSWLRKRVRNKI